MNNQGKLTVINPQGATIRVAPNTGGGSIRLARAGTVLDCQGAIPLAGGDIWAVLTAKDPETARPWRYGVNETVAFIAVYVKGVEYCKLDTVPGQGVYQQGWNDCLESLASLLPTLRK